MARKTGTITIDQEGRDHGKSFFLTEMPATQAEKWATRALLAMARAGADIPDNVSDMGMAALADPRALLTAIGNLAFADAEPLLDEMFSCVAFNPSGSIVRPLIENDIEEVKTRLLLRSEVIALHTGFSIVGSLSKAAQSTTVLAAL